MGRKLIIFLILIAFIFSVSVSDLRCSANGTSIFYINGVNVPKTEFEAKDKDGKTFGVSKPRRIDLAT